MLWLCTDFVDAGQGMEQTPTDWYAAPCPQTGNLLQLPRTVQAEAIARGLMAQLAHSEECLLEGKMFGVLLVATASGEIRVLKAFSGLLNGCNTVTGWVPPIPGRAEVAVAEQETLAQLTAIKHQLLELQTDPVRSQLDSLTHQFTAQWQHLTDLHAQRKAARQHQRQQLLADKSGTAAAIALDGLDAESRQDGLERKRWKRDRDQVLAPLRQHIEAIDQQIHTLKQQRKHLSKQLQTQMHRAYRLSNFAGQSASLSDLSPQEALPTGTGDCCAPKLLHYAATHSLKPLALAEFWWGPSPSNGDKRSGEFYGACAERCQPILGFLLSGLPPAIALSHPPDLPIVYHDDWVIVVNKPAGLLSVPGRDRPDSAWARLQLTVSESVLAVHRLDQDTSGLLVFARDPATHRALNRQFQQRQVHKVYEAVLDGHIWRDRGTIELPLRADWEQRPYQRVDWQAGKPSITTFQVLSRTATTTRIEFLPLTGRTHQLRVHAAHPDGLNAPIRGDCLYGTPAQRLHLHARELSLLHPQTHAALQFTAETPF